ncbi:unnamed protein product [Prunus armeniaca]
MRRSIFGVIDGSPTIYFPKVELIRSIPLSLRRVKDNLIWHLDKKGQFTVKSAYHVARRRTMQPKRGMPHLLPRMVMVLQKFGQLFGQPKCQRG